MMAVTKKSFSITVDCDLYEAAKTKYGKISPRINELLVMDLYGSDEKDQLLQELHELKIREKAITKKICELEKNEIKIKEEESNKEAVLKWVASVYSRNGVIGLNLLEKECKRYNVNFDIIKDYLESEEIATVKFA